MWPARHLIELEIAASLLSFDEPTRGECAVFQLACSILYFVTALVGSLVWVMCINRKAGAR
jgi:hypothetical protein